MDPTGVSSSVQSQSGMRNLMPCWPGPSGGCVRVEVSRVGRQLALSVLMRDNDHGLQQRCAEGGGHGNITGIPPSPNQHPTLTSFVVARIEGPPAITQVDLHPCREIHRQIARRNIYLWQVAEDIARRNVECAAERHCEVGEVPADAVATGVNIGGSRHGRARAVLKLEMIMDVLA